MRRAAPLGLAILVGALFGAAIRLGDGRDGVIGWLVDLAGPWLVLGVVVGAAIPTLPASAGALALAAGVAAKFALQAAQGDIGGVDLVVRLLGWGAAAVAVGVLAGRAGLAARQGVAWAPWLVGLALALEALVVVVSGERGWSLDAAYAGQEAARAVLAGELAVGALAMAAGLWRLVRRPPAEPDWPG
ncbi:MAG: hypothetical protein R3C15_16070 [Thermoleophilia bacterium]